MLYEHLVFPLLVKTYPDPEEAHARVLKGLDALSISPSVCAFIRNAIAPPNYKLRTRVAGISFPNPVGLAAGYAKEPVGLHGLAALGFGFLEIGTITPEAQPGNPQPRIVRLPRDGALINRMGFPNGGAYAAGERLRIMPKLPVPLGINIGKGKDTPLEEAAEDYVLCYNMLARYADYIVVNVSSPNTPGLRALQRKESLQEILEALKEQKEMQHDDPFDPNIDLQVNLRVDRPIFVKVTSDLEDDELEGVMEVVSELADGIIATNTTMKRDRLLSDDELVNEKGGLSGHPIHLAACRTVRRIRQELPQTAIIGVGGISSPDDVTRMRDAGADLFQVYTGLIYKGPFLPRTLIQALA